MSTFFPHEFEAELGEFGVGKTRKVWYRVVFLPPDLEEQLPFDEYPRLRVDGEIADVPVNSAWMPTGDGRRYLIVGPEVVRTAGLGIGDSVTVRFRIADQDHVDVPDALELAIASSPAAAKVWEALTPGKKRALAHHVGSAKTDATRARRVAQALAALTDNGGSLR